MARLMKVMGLQSIILGKPAWTTIQDKKQPCPLDHAHRIFKADRPNQLWVSDFTYVRIWKGFVYVAFVIDGFLSTIVGWKDSTTAHAEFVLDALNQARYARRPAKDEFIHNSDRSSQYLSIKYTEKLADAGIQPSVGSVGDSYNNALAETINGHYKAEVIHSCGPWRNLEDVEIATLASVNCFNNHRLPESIGNIPSGKLEANYYASPATLKLVTQPPRIRPDICRVLEREDDRCARADLPSSRSF
jgi:putative transposase